MKVALVLVALVMVLVTTVPCDAYSRDVAVEVDQYTIQSGQIGVYFPQIGDDPAPVLVKLYDSANMTLDIAIYSLTSPVIIRAIERAKERGIVVRVITDRREEQTQYQHIAIDDLRFDGIPVLINSHSGLMHLKMSVVDDKIATVGSYNYSLAASQTNDDMLVIITEPLFAKKCADEFDRMWTDSKNFEVVGATK
jgi:phosphatidylserine/phosphatidylglycerophosphate/cardiolipin synthase-like enzyme